MSLWRTASGKERSKVRYALCSQANTFQSMEAQYNVINMNHDFIRTDVFQMNVRVRVDVNWKPKIDDSFIYQGGGGSAFSRRVSDVKIEFVVLLSDWNEKVWDEPFQNGLR